MSEIRSLERADLPAVASLLELVYRSGTRNAPPAFVTYLDRIFLEGPWSDPDIPSLVYVEEPDGIVGFVGSHVRRFRFDDRSIRVAVSGQMAVEPGARRRAVGAFLLQRYLAGPQDMTMTDSASETVRRMWEGLGGDTLHLERMGWLRLFRPLRFASEYAWGRHRSPGPTDRIVATLAGPVDRLAVRLGGRNLSTSPSSGVGERLTPELMVEHLATVTQGCRMRPEYDEVFLRWLFDEMGAVAKHGRLVGVMIRDDGGRTLGWYVYYLKPGGISQVLQIAGVERDLPGVVDHLFHHARTNGAAALQGRIEPALVELLSLRHCLFHVGGYRVLFHTSEPAYLQALATGRGSLSRLDGDWWISLSRGPFSA